MADTLFKEVSRLPSTNLKDAAESAGLNLKFKSNNHKDGAEYSTSCPFDACTCDDDGFLIFPDADNGKGRYWCRVCGKGGDTADFLERVQGIPHNEALELAGIDLKSGTRQHQKSTEPKQDVNRDLWGQQAAIFFGGHSRQIEGSKGEAVLADKGISLETAKAFNLKYNPADTFLNKKDWGIPATNEEKKNKKFTFVIPAGLLIQIFNKTGHITRLVVRRETPYNGNRYHEVRGSESQQPLIAGNTTSDHIFIIESFLDVISLHQAAGDLAQFVAGGGTSFTPDQQMLESLSSKQIHLSLDNDEAGINAAKRLKALIPTAKVLPILHGKDPSEAAANGLNLRAWIEAGISGDYSKVNGLAEEIKRVKAIIDADKPSVRDRLSGLTVKKDYVQMIGNEEWLFNNLIIKNQITVLCAKSGGGKTTISFFFVAGYLIQNLDLTVFYFDLDSPASDHKRMFQHAESMGQNFNWINPLTHGKGHEVIREALDDFVKANERLDNVVFFFDTLKKFIDMLDKKSVKPFFSLLRQLTSLGATIVLLGHANKHRGVDGNLIFEGVGDIQSDTDALLFFERITNPDGSVDVTTVCSSDKGAKVRGLYEPITFHIAKDRSVTLKRDITPVPDFSSNNAKKHRLTDEDILEKIRDHLFHEGMRVSQNNIVAALKNEPGTEAVGINRLRSVLNAYAVPEMSARQEGQIFYSDGGVYNKKLYGIFMQTLRER